MNDYTFRYSTKVVLDTLNSTTSPKPSLAIAHCIEMVHAASVDERKLVIKKGGF